MCSAGTCKHAVCARSWPLLLVSVGKGENGASGRAEERMAHRRQRQPPLFRPLQPCSGGQSGRLRWDLSGRRVPTTPGLEPRLRPLGGAHTMGVMAGTLGGTGTGTGGKRGDHGFSLQCVLPGLGSSRTGSTTGHLEGRKKELAPSTQNPPEPEVGEERRAPQAHPFTNRRETGCKDIQDLLRTSRKPGPQVPHIYRHHCGTTTKKPRGTWPHCARTS